jgi:hypothetical protein
MVGKNGGKNDGLEQYHLTADRCGAKQVNQLFLKRI